VFNKIFLYFQRRRQHSYTDLWEMLYGDGHQGSKGYIREANFAMEVAGMWKQSFEECQKRYNSDSAGNSPG
jgi:hypothetical protein